MKNGIKVLLSNDEVTFAELWTVDGLYWSSNHRTDGPAVIFNDRTRKDGWYINGNRYDDAYEYVKDSGLNSELASIMILKYGSELR